MSVSRGLALPLQGRLEVCQRTTTHTHAVDAAAYGGTAAGREETAFWCAVCLPTRSFFRALSILVILDTKPLAHQCVDILHAPCWLLPALHIGLVWLLNEIHSFENLAALVL
jgi:hypothetical protein